MATKRKRTLRPRKRSSEASTSTGEPDVKKSGTARDDDDDLELFTIKSSGTTESNNLFRQAPLAAMHLCHTPADDDGTSNLLIDNHRQSAVR
jgi:hypothetical protein